MQPEKRKLKLAVISDVHLGTYGCHAKELLFYLTSMEPEILVLNGDIIDMWQFKKSYFPNEHLRVIKHITGLMAKGIPVYYVTGNHDEMMRRFAGFEMGSFKIVNKMVLNLDGKDAWFFHGDVFDVTMKSSKWVARLGSTGYDFLILLNRLANYVSEKLGRGKISFAAKIKKSVKNAVKHINNFEQTAAEIGISNGYAYVVCGHIHQPEIRTITSSRGSIQYLNSGDWVENLTALEYNDGAWRIYRFNEDAYANSLMDEDAVTAGSDENEKELFEQLLREFRAVAA
ncbi:MAG TPA: UDP-2,3-diacylglucosamine diphosphatase [Chitinophagales bacterium]|nr:UDP-2,3-diacylglucosamine diphosphatase [Chitinophagales bacterium]